MPNELTPEQADIQQRFAEATRQPSLFEIVERGMLVLAQLEQTEGEVTPSISADLEALAESLESKTEVYAALHRRLNTNADACEEYAQHYTDRAKRLRNTAELLKQRLLDAMRALGQPRIKTPTASAAIEKSPPALEFIVPEDKLDQWIAEPELWEVKRTPRKDAIKKLLLSGEVLAYARLKRGSHLRFR